MVGDGAVVSASSTKDHYAFGESNAARKAFAGRTIDADLAFLVPFLKPGLSLVDCGCGGGGLAVQLSERLAPSFRQMVVQVSADRATGPNDISVPGPTRRTSRHVRYPVAIG
jgi:hypothetical protein